MLRFSLIGCSNHILKIGDQWERRDHDTAVTWRSYQSAECQKYPLLAKFPRPIQALIVEQLKKAVAATEQGEFFHW